MDLNNDGHLDIITGSYEDGVHYFKGTGNGNLAAVEKIVDSDGVEVAGTGRFLVPSITDLNDDGLLDLIVSSANDGIVDNNEVGGGLQLFINTGTAENYNFEAQGYIQDVNGDEIRYVYNRVIVADMNNDGLKDIVCASTYDSGNKLGSEVFLHTNIGTAAKPVYDEREILHYIDGSELLSEYAIRIGITDYDNDGVKDLLFNSGQHYPGKIGLLRGTLGNGG